jgi:hypothetical protein
MNTTKPSILLQVTYALAIAMGAITGICLANLFLAC